MKTTLEIAHALRKTAAWERDPDRDWQRCRFHSALEAHPDGGMMPTLPTYPDAIQFCATGRLMRMLSVNRLGYVAELNHYSDELHEIERLHDEGRFCDAAVLLDGLALLVEETIPTVVTA